MSDDDLRARLREEMSAVQRPPLAELVESAVVRGHHVQRRRRLVSGLGVVAIAAAAAVISLGGQWSDQGDLSSAEKKDAGVAVTDPNARSGPPAESMIRRRSVAGMIFTPGPSLEKTAAPDGVPATPEGLLE